METIDLLIEIAGKTGLYGEEFFKTGVIAKKLGVSQQTISNLLRNLESKGFIEREPSYAGIKISIAEDGRIFLEKYKKRLNSFFETPKEFEGKVFTGIGEGSFYIRQKGYKKQFKDKLNLKPFNGTLNLIVEPIVIKSFLSGKKMTEIRGFKSENRTFGGLRSYSIRINNVPGAIIVPDRTHYKHDTIEIISDFYLRGRLKLKDGDKVKITEANL